MPSGILVRHFLSQLVENDVSGDSDRHQVLAIAAAGLITIPLFVTVFMSVKYLMRPLQSAGWTETTAMGDAVTFSAASMLVTAVITALEWDALALNARDVAILGVLPLSRAAIVRAKVRSLLAFAGAFVIALDALPSLLHPLFMSVQLPMSPVLLLPLMAAQALGTMLAGAFGFAMVLAIRESLSFVLGRQRFALVSGAVRSVLLFVLLILLALVPVRLSGSADWMFEEHVPALLTPVSWFAATDGAITGRVIDPLPRPRLPASMAAEETRLTEQYRRALPKLTRRAWQGAGALAAMLACSLALYVWNARRWHLMLEDTGARTVRRFDLLRRAAAGLASPHSTRTGLLFLVRTVSGSAPHRVFLIVALVAGLAVFLAAGIDPFSIYDGPRVPAGTSTLAAQTLLTVAIVAGFRAAIRTSADVRAAWIFDAAQTAERPQFRAGVRRGALLAVAIALVAVLPFQAASWGLATASAHAVDGAALGWLFVEAAMGGVPRPLVDSIPPPDGLNTVGVGLLGATVIAIFAAAHIEEATLTTTAGRVLFPIPFAASALWLRLRSRE